MSNASVPWRVEREPTKTERAAARRLTEACSHPRVMHGVCLACGGRWVERCECSHTREEHARAAMDPANPLAFPTRWGCSVCDCAECKAVGAFEAPSRPPQIRLVERG